MKVERKMKGGEQQNEEEELEKKARQGKKRNRVMKDTRIQDGEQQSSREK